MSPVAARFVYGLIAALSLMGTSARAAEVAFVYMTDYFSQAVLGTFGVGQTTVTNVNLPSLHTDVALRAYSGKLYVIERWGKDAVTVLDPNAPNAPLANYSVGNASNPYDLVFESEAKAYVMRYERKNLLVINPANGDSLGTVDLSSFADADGNTEIAGGVLVDTTLYVILQMLDRSGTYWVPAGLGKVVMVNTKTNQVTGSITLTIDDPDRIIAHGSKLYVTGGDYSDFSKTGVDTINLATHTAGRLTEGLALGGRPTYMAFASGDSVAWLVTPQTWPTGKVYKIRLATGAIADSLAELVSPASLAISSDNEILVADRNEAGAGVFVFNAATGAKVQGPISTPVPPDAVAFVSLSVGVATARPVPTGARILANRPNPFNPATAIPFSVPATGPVRLVVYDLLGQPVRTLVSGVVPVGTHQVTWDGLGDRGTFMPSGVYLVRLETTGGADVRRIVLAR